MPYKNKKIAFVFPGQGAQYVGMGSSFTELCPNLLKPLLDFDEKNRTNLYEIIRHGPEEVLKETKWTQPAILFHSIAAMKCFQEVLDIQPDFVAGHSLGEFTALAANNVLSVEDAMYLVHRRGEFMIKANDDTPIAMSAIIGLDSKKLKEICEEVSKENLVVVANYNTPEQTVISGTRDGVKIASERAVEEGAKRAIPLAVGGAFHSPLVAKAGVWLAEEMEKIQFCHSEIPVISNVDALPQTDLKKIKDNLVKQVTSSVLWIDCVNTLVELGTDIFIEFGPKKVLAGMLKKIDKKLKIMSVDDYVDLVTVKDNLIEMTEQ